MKRNYLSGLLIAALMMVCSVSLASESPDFESVAMDTGQPVTVAALASAHEQHDNYKHFKTEPVFKSMSADNEPCRLYPRGVVLVACNTGKTIKSFGSFYAKVTQSMLTPSKIPIVT